LYFQSDLGRRAASSWARPHISSCFISNLTGQLSLAISTGMRNQ